MYINVDSHIVRHCDLLHVVLIFFPCSLSDMFVIKDSKAQSKWQVDTMRRHENNLFPHQFHILQPSHTKSNFPRLEYAHPGDYDWEAIATNTGRSVQV